MIMPNPPDSDASDARVAPLVDPGDLDPGDLASKIDIAWAFNVSRQAVQHWIHRPDFPTPIVRIGKSTDLYLLSQVRAWRAVRPERPKAEHGGSGSLYVRGCRCDECRATNNARYGEMRSARTRRLAADPTLAPHGSASTYLNWGCRCADCTAANSARCGEYKRQRKLAAALVADGYDPPPAVGQDWIDPQVTWLPDGHQSIVRITAIGKPISGWQARVIRRQVDANGTTVPSGDGAGEIYLDHLLRYYRPADREAS